MKKTKPLIVIKVDISLSPEDCKRLKEATQKVMVDYEVLVCQVSIDLWDSIRFELVDPT